MVNGSELRALRRDIRDVAQGISDLENDIQGRMPSLLDTFDPMDDEDMALSIGIVDHQLEELLGWLRGELARLRSEVQGLGNRLEAAVQVEEPALNG